MSRPLHYKLVQKLDCSHGSTVTALAFSPRGSYLAAGNLNGTLSICSTSSGQTLHEVQVASGVSILSVVWIAHDEHQLLCGLGNGVVISATITTCVSVASCAPDRYFNIIQEVTVTGFRAHDNLPVECLSISGSTVVTAAFSEVSLWDHSSSSVYHPLVGKQS